MINSKTIINKQKGIGLIGLMVGLCLIIILTRMLVNVVPLYTENNSVINHLPNSMPLQIAYEVRTNFLTNIDFFMKFDDEEEVVR